MKHESEVNRGFRIHNGSRDFQFVTLERMAPKYTYYERGTERRDRRRTPLRGEQYQDRSSCCHIVAFPLQANLRIRMSLKRVS